MAPDTGNNSPPCQPLPQVAPASHLTPVLRGICLLPYYQCRCLARGLSCLPPLPVSPASHLWLALQRRCSWMHRQHSGLTWATAFLAWPPHFSGPSSPGLPCCLASTVLPTSLFMAVTPGPPANINGSVRRRSPHPPAGLHLISFL